MHYLTFNGQRSDQLGILIDEHEGYKAPERDYEVVEVPGRNGDLTIDNGRYKNVKLTYKCGIGVGFHDRMDEVRAWLMSNVGYKRLEDTYHPDHYRMARVASAPDPDVFAGRRGGRFDLVFDAKPQRFLKTGETEQSFTSSGTITNPTRYNALPLLRVYGTGYIVINNARITISSANSYTDIDCDIQDAYKGSTNCNGNITLDSGAFPVLAPGSNGITLSGVSRVIITPRWWTI